MTQGIEGKVVVTAGASSGPGEATARHLARHGAMPVLPLHVHQGLGLGTVVVGLVAGS